MCVRTVILLLCSNIFMTVAWYGHLKFKRWPLLVVILLSWLIALPEYALQVPANRLGYGQFTAAQLKIIQEVISITVFCDLQLLLFERVANVEDRACIPPHRCGRSSGGRAIEAEGLGGTP